MPRPCSLGGIYRPKIQSPDQLSVWVVGAYLRWRAASRSNEDRFAPLVLIPVNLERSNAGEKFHLKWSGEDIEANLSLQLHVEREFGLKLPSILEFESLDIDAYMATTTRRTRPRSAAKLGARPAAALGPPVGFPVQFRIVGPDTQVVRRIAREVEKVVHANPSVRDVQLDWNDAGPPALEAS